MAAPKPAGENLVMRQRRLRYRAWHRGTREMDLILGPFCDAKADTLEETQLDALEVLMDENDVELFRWVTGESEAPSGHRETIAALRQWGMERAL